MCGIAGIYLKNPLDPYVNGKELEDLVDWLHCGIEHRGTHATGIAVQGVDGSHHLEKSDMPASHFIFWRREVPENPQAIILHTRFATKGKPENLLNNHPVEWKNVIAVHNGHISNDDELFKEEELERLAEVDSEIIPALLSKYTFDDPKAALEKMGGGFAIAAFDSLNPGKLLLAKGSSSPLHYLETSGMVIWASEEKVIKDAMAGALNFEVKATDIRELHYGRYLMLEGDKELDPEEFKVYYKQWNPGTYQGGYNRVGNRSYTDGWHNTGQRESLYGRNQCDECFVWYADHMLNPWGKEFFCDHCEKKLFDIDENGARKRKPVKKLSRKERKRLRKAEARRFQEEKSRQKAITIPKGTEGIAEVLDAEHWAVCQLVAEFYGTQPEFVSELIFMDADVNDFDDESLSIMYSEFEAKYKEILEEVRIETDKVIDGISCSVDNPFPTGFGGM